MRDNQRMPEPKNYRTWRDEIARLEEGAKDGSYQELWTLPDGQSYRVIGRPHPDGAVAFMFEDITSEMTLTRKFRGDLDLYQSVLDDTKGALAVFGHDAQLLLSNEGYAQLWGDDPRERVGGMNLIEASRIWQELTEPTGLWGDIRDFLGRNDERDAWSETVQMRDGRRLLARVAPIAAGAITVRFTEMIEEQILSAPYLSKPDRQGASASVYEAAEPMAPFVSRRARSETA